MDLSSDIPGPLGGECVWTATDLPTRGEWKHHLEESEQAELRALVDLLEEDDNGPTVNGQPLEQTAAADLPLVKLAPRLAAIQQQLEQGAGAVRLHGFPLEGLTEEQARLLYWAMAVRIGTPVSQSAKGERIFSVRDAGFGDADPRSRGPNTSKRLSFHTDRSDVVGFLCLKQAREGGENEIASRPLDPLFLDNYGPVEAGAIRGGMRAAT